MEPCEGGGRLGHLLVDRNRVAISRTELATSQPDLLAIVMVPQTARMMQSADGSDHTAMFFQRLQRSRELVTFAGRRNLVVKRVDAVGNVDEGATPRRFRLGSMQRTHAVQQRKRNEAAKSTQDVTTVDLPGVSHESALRGFRSDAFSARSASE